MTTTTILLILLAAAVAFGLAWFQYLSWYRNHKVRGLLLVCLRFVSIFGLLLLLVNPKFSRFEYYIEKTKLLVLVDNSSSMREYGSELTSLLDAFGGNAGIQERFDRVDFQFGQDIGPLNELDFSAERTDIRQALSSVEPVGMGRNSTVVLLSDGNQTYGTDYSFFGSNGKQPIYPIVMGDTTRYEDLRIDRVNVNTYAFLNNKFPIEIYVSYMGDRSLSGPFSIYMDGKKVHGENLSFSKTKGSQVIKTFLEASQVGQRNIKVQLFSLEGERNGANNQKNVSVEVIDEKTEVALVTAMSHPDIGAIKKAVESNEQRTLTIHEIPVEPGALENADLFVLYQPNTAFAQVYDIVKKKGVGYMVVAGTHTDWRFLNQVEKDLTTATNYPIQEVSPVSIPDFSRFDISEYDFLGFPPLDSDAGGIQFSLPAETMVGTRIKGAVMDQPLISVRGDGPQRSSFIFGEGLWKWRMQTFRNDQDFSSFDGLFGKLFLYLANSKSKNRLEVRYKSVYEGSVDARISASYFDGAFVFDPDTTPILKLSGKDGGGINREMPMLLKGGYFESDLSDLPAGAYSFTVTVPEEGHTKSGNFTILDFDVERQLLASDFGRLQTLAQGSGGAVFYPDQIEALMDTLASDQRFVPVQKGKENIVSLIDFKLLLGIIAIALALEWFLRKYYGHI
ncbi:MAG: vWA domain-containing protein [Flavobacteriaceae bacterium]